MSHQNDESSQPKKGLFHTTQWKAVTHGKRAGREERERAQTKFCWIYWRPIFCVIVGRGYKAHDAEDLTQGFLLHFLESNAVARADPRRGRFRDFLVAALDHYLSDERERAHALKRGGGYSHVGLDEPGVTELCETNKGTARAHAIDSTTDRAWAMDLLVTVLDQLEAQYERKGRGHLFRSLKAYLTSDELQSQSYLELSQRLERSPATLRSDVKRLRAEFRDGVLEELQRKAGMERLEEELANLRDILRRS